MHFRYRIVFGDHAVSFPSLQAQENMNIRVMNRDADIQDDSVGQKRAGLHFGTTIFSLEKIYLQLYLTPVNDFLRNTIATICVRIK